MEIKDIIVYLAAGSPCGAELDLAAGLAQRSGAMLSGFCTWREPALEPADSFVLGAAVAEVLERELEAIDGTVAPTAAAFHKAARAHGVEAVWTAAVAFEPPESLALHARCADLAVVRRPEPGDGDDRRLAEALVLTSGVPVLVVPASARPAQEFASVAIGWDGGRAARRALEDALPLLKLAANVTLLAIDRGEAAAPPALGAERALAWLARHGIDARLERSHRPAQGVGATLLRQCRSAGADLLVMGAYGHPRAAERLLGGATRHVLSRADLPVLMSH